jgi:small subunit ribosomal protein S20
MANHKSALKRIRSNETKRLSNRYYHKTMRNALRKYRATSDAKELEDQLPKVASMIDRLAKKNVIHKNKAGNLKSSLQRHLMSVKA